MDEKAFGKRQETKKGRKFGKIFPQNGSLTPNGEYRRTLQFW